MKKLIIGAITLLAASVFTPASAIAQAPEKMSYQAIVRDADGELVRDSQVGVQIQINDDGTAISTTSYTPTTDANGVISLEIDVSGVDFSTAGPFEITSSIDPTGGTTYSISGTSELMSVPFALRAKTVETIDDNAVTTSKIADAAVTEEKLDKANIPLSSFGAADSDLDLGSNSITNLADPSDNQDAATKKIY